MGLLSRLLGGRRGATERTRFSIIAHVAFEGAIHVTEAPVGAAWEYDEDERDGDGYWAMTLKYILPEAPSPLALLAKIYTIKRGFQRPALPGASDWRESLGPLYAEITSLAAQPAIQTTMKGTTLTAVEANVDGPRAESGAPLHIRERRAVLNEELFIVTAMGTPEQFAAHASDIDRWFSTVAFVPLAESKPR